MKMMLKFRNDMMEMFNQELKAHTLCIGQGRVYLDFQPDIIKIFLRNEDLSLDLQQKETEFLSFLKCSHFFESMIMENRRSDLNRICLSLESNDFKKFVRNLKKKGPYEENYIVLGRDAMRNVCLKVLRVGQVKLTLSSKIKMTSKDYSRQDLVFVFKGFFKSMYLLKMFKFVHRACSNLMIHFSFEQVQTSGTVLGNDQYDEQQQVQAVLQLEDSTGETKITVKSEQVIELDSGWMQENKRFSVRLLATQLKQVADILLLDNATGILLGILMSGEIIFQLYNTLSANQSGTEVISETIMFLHSEFEEYAGS